MAFKDNEKDTFSFDDLADEENFKEDNEKKGLFNKNKDKPKIDTSYISNPEDLISSDDSDELYVTTSSASAISDLVSRNNEDVTADDEEKRKKLLAEIESELNGNSGKTGAVKTVNKPIKKPEVKKEGIKKEEVRKAEVKNRKKPNTNPMDAKEKLLAQRQMELDNIMKEIGIEEGTFNTKSEEEVKAEEEEAERREIIEQSKILEKATVPAKKPISKKEFDINDLLTTRNIIILCAVAFIIILISIIISLVLNKETSNNAVLTVKDKIIVKSPTNKYVMTFGDISSRVSVENISMNNGYEYFTKIRVKVKNKKNGTADMRNANEFILIGVNNEKISTCLTSSDLSSYNTNDALPSTIPAKSTVEGYLYCKSNITYLPKLQITALREIDESAAQRGELVGLSAYSYIVNLGT